MKNVIFFLFLLPLVASAQLRSGGTVTGNRAVNTGYGTSGGGNLSADRTIIADSATLSAYYKRQKDSLTANNPTGYVTRTVLKDSLNALGTIVAEGDLGVPMGSVSGTTFTVKAMLDGTNIDVVNTSDTTATANITGQIGVANGGTGLSTVATNSYLKGNGTGALVPRTYSEVRTDLGLVIGTDVQAWDTDLNTWSGITPGSGVGTFLATPSSANFFSAITDESGSAGVVPRFNLTSAAQGDIAYYNGTNWVNLAPGTSGHFLKTQGAGANPIWDAASGSGYTNLTQFVDQTAWRLFYSNGSGDITELALGTSGQYLKSNGATSAPTFDTPAGSGDVTKVGTPVDNQVGVWTGNGTIEGDADFTFDGTNITTNGILIANGESNAVQSVTTAAGTTTLTSTSNFETIFTGSSTQTLVMPDATTLTVGRKYHISNTSTAIGGITVNANGGGALTKLLPTESADIICTSIGTSAGTWEINVTKANTDENVMAYRGGNATMRYQTAWQLHEATTTSALSDAQLRMIAIQISAPITLTGVQVFQTVAGNYTGDQNNKVGLYTFDGSANMTKVAESTNSSTLWVGSANAIRSIAFSSTYFARPGTYWIAYLYNQSAQTTAPTLGASAGVTASMANQGGMTTNLALSMTFASQTDLPSSIAISGSGISTTRPWGAVYQP